MIFTFQKGHAILTSMEHAQATNATKQHKEEIAEVFEVQPGLIVRYPITEKYIYTQENVDQHYNYFAYASASPKKARQIIYYGLFRLFHYNAIPITMNIAKIGLKDTIKEYIRCTRQPYKIGAYALMGFGVCDPISYLHLLITILIEPFKSGTSGKKLLHLFAENALGLGKPLALLFKLLMHIKYGKNYMHTIYKIYYGNNFPELLEAV